jgi:hypothetical protein
MQKRVVVSAVKNDYHRFLAAYFQSLCFFAKGGGAKMKKARHLFVRATVTLIFLPTLFSLPGLSCCANRTF